MGAVSRDIMEIASLIVGLAVLGLLITRSGNTAQVIGAASQGFGGLISVATFQNGYGNPFATAGLSMQF